MATIVIGASGPFYVIETGSRSAILQGLYLAETSVSVTVTADTVAASASLLSGAAAGAAPTSGTTITASASLLPGAATGPAAADGALITVDASLVAGTATTDATTDATADGAIVTADASLIAGAATATTEPLPVHRTGPIPWLRYRRDGNALGDTIGAEATLSPGMRSASAVAVVGNALTVPHLSIVAGAASASDPEISTITDEQLLLIFAEAA